MTFGQYIRKRMHEFDWFYLLFALLLATAGLIAIYSIEFQQEAERTYFGRQVVWVVFGSILMVATYLIPRKLVHNLAYIAYGLGVLSLGALLVLGRGASVSRWINFGSLGVQPSEFMKVLLLVSLARYFADHKRQLTSVKELMTPAAMTLLPMLLVLMQPDLGTALVYIATLIVVIFWAGIRPLYFFLLLAPMISMLASFQTLSFFIWMAILLVMLWLGRMPLWTSIINFTINIMLGGVTNLLWGLLKPYQQQRILSMFNAEADPLGAGYQLSQSLTAFGSGGPFGKGFGQGTQTHLKFLPEQHTDFIMTVIGEEFGFLGVTLVIAVFYLLFARLVNQAYSSKYRFDSVVLIGVTGILVFHSFVNLGMIVGIMPVTGIPLPFISYGGSFMFTSMILLGLAANMSTSYRAAG